MVTITGTVTIAVAPGAFLALVTDTERYAQVDDKIRPVLWSRRRGDRVEFTCRPKLASLRHPTVVQFLHLTSGERIDIGLLPPPANRLRCSFSAATRWLLEAMFSRRLAAAVRDELRRASQYLEAAR